MKVYVLKCHKRIFLEEESCLLPTAYCDRNRATERMEEHFLEIKNNWMKDLGEDGVYIVTAGNFMSMEAKAEDGDFYEICVEDLELEN